MSTSNSHRSAVVATRGRVVLLGAAALLVLSTACLDSQPPLSGTPCTSDEDCDDGLFCTGIEKCGEDDVCLLAEPPCFCACEEETQLCLDCCTNDVCRAPFESEQCLEPCEASSLSDDEDFDQSFEEALGECDDSDPFSSYIAGYVAECDASGLMVIVLSDGLHLTANFYEEENGGFVGQRCWSDFIDETCAGRHYWPIAVDCDEAVITEVICGDSSNVGDVKDLLF